MRTDQVTVQWAGAWKLLFVTRRKSCWVIRIVILHSPSWRLTHLQLGSPNAIYLFKPKHHLLVIGTPYI